MKRMSRHQINAVIHFPVQAADNSLSPSQMVTVRVMAESIWTDIQSEPVLRACTSFSELYDHCDANMLGFQSIWADTCGIEKVTPIINAATDMVDGWLKNGYSL